MSIFDKKNIVKINDDDIKDANLSASGVQNESAYKRAFTNILAARLGMKLLFNNKIDANNLYSLYTIHKVLEEIDIADINSKDIKIDARLVFDANELFIPKSHFEYGLQPDLYLFFKLNSNFSNAEFLGFIEADSIDKSNSNIDYYFAEPQSLIGWQKLKNFLKNYKKVNPLPSTDIEIKSANNMLISYIDNELSQIDKKFLYRQLALNLSLRKTLVEFQDFEMISTNIGKKKELFGDNVLEIVGSQNVYNLDEAGLLDENELVKINANSKGELSEVYASNNEINSLIQEDTSLIQNAVKDEFSDLDFENIIDNMDSMQRIHDEQKGNQENQENQEELQEFVEENKEAELEPLQPLQEFMDVDIVPELNEVDEISEEPIAIKEEIQPLEMLQDFLINTNNAEIEELVPITYEDKEETLDKTKEVPLSSFAMDTINVIPSQEEAVESVATEATDETHTFATIEEITEPKAEVTIPETVTDIASATKAEPNIEIETNKDLNTMSEQQKADSTISHENTKQTTNDEVNSQDSDALQALFSKENIAEVPQQTRAPKATSNNKNVIAGISIAAVICVAVVAATNFTNNKNNSNNLAQLNRPAVQQMNGQQVQPNMMPDNMGVPDMPLEGDIMPKIHDDNDIKSAPNNDINKSISNAIIDTNGVSVSKVAWEIPENIAYNDSIRKYLQIAGKNLKLALQNDLLLATDIPYSNSVIIDLKVNSGGDLQSTKIMTSSGSKQIDTIVLQSVKETLKYVKLPQGEVSGNNLNVTLIINF